MKWLATVISLTAALTARADVDWAYPVFDESALPASEFARDREARRTVPGSSLQFSQNQIDDHWNPPDWFPDDHHAPVPEVVAKGDGPNVRACAACHGFAGAGFPQTSHLAGLTPGYIRLQMADFRSAAQRSMSGSSAMRRDRSWMNTFEPTQAQIDAAAEWYSALPVRDWL